MDFSSEPIFQWLAQYAYEPEIVYLSIFGMMMASGFGFPLPEEVTILSVGVLTYMGAHPEIFPPPTPGARGINGYEAAAVTLFSVLFADLIVFSLGRIFGRKVTRWRFLKSVFSHNNMERINSWVHKYGHFATFIFRFTPGIRFPAHVALGISKIPTWEFLFMDFLAALISVPTQILLIYHYGEPILLVIHRFKIWILSFLAIAILIGVLRKMWTLRQRKAF